MAARPTHTRTPKALRRVRSIARQPVPKQFLPEQRLGSVDELFQLFQYYRGQPKKCRTVPSVVAKRRKSSVSQKSVYRYPGHRVITDVASGVNFKRPGLRALLDAIHRGNVKEVVVLHRDRLARFALDLLEYHTARKDGTPERRRPLRNHPATGRGPYGNHNRLCGKPSRQTSSGAVVVPKAVEKKEGEVYERVRASGKWVIYHLTIGMD